MHIPNKSKFVTQFSCWLYISEIFLTPTWEGIVLIYKKRLSVLPKCLLPDLSAVALCLYVSLFCFMTNSF